MRDDVCEGECEGERGDDARGRDDDDEVLNGGGVVCGVCVDVV